jgi:hypothetical protein
VQQAMPLISKSPAPRWHPGDGRYIGTRHGHLRDPELHNIAVIAMVQRRDASPVDQSPKTWAHPRAKILARRRGAGGGGVRLRAGDLDDGVVSPPSGLQYEPLALTVVRSMSSSCH